MKKIVIIISCIFLLMSFKNDVNKFDDLINEFEGKVIYVDIWATWCAPCVKSIPYTKKVKEKYKNKNVEVVFLSIDGDKKSGKKFRKN
jgi:thiol-disulfide isomerase/thioredoxin